ncbi:MAG: hypothetical protein IPM51_07220 [Sphingobacteriaceae bacterium]|nr:hypothetical protein [Sphingobacteriaceae bacterium]
MPIIEYNEIETFVGENSPIWKDLLLSLGGVVVGFTLSESASWIREWKKKQKIGTSFDFEITALREPLKNQIGDIKDLKSVVVKYENVSPSLFIFKNLEFVKSLDRNIVSEYFKSKHGENNLKRTREIYNTLSVVEAEMERYNKFYEEFNIKLSANYHSYRMILTEYSRNLVDYDLLNSSQQNNDTYIISITTLFQQTVFSGGAISNIMPFEKSFHMPILNLNIKAHGHPFCEISSRHNQSALDVIMNVKIDTESFLSKLDNIEKSLKNCYERIYQEKL